MIFADGVRCYPKRNRTGKFHFIEQPVLQCLLVERHIVATPYRGYQEIWLGRNGLGNMRGKVRAEQLGPRLRNDLDIWQELLQSDVEMIKSVATIAVVGMDV